MSTERPAAACVDLGKTYFTESAEVRALVGVDAEFAPTAMTAVVGPSGSGKSSLLRILAALEPPTSGSVLVRGHDLARFPESRLRTIRRSEVGYVFQRPSDNFVSYLSLDEHIELARAQANGEVPDAEELLDELGLSNRRNRIPRELSGGEQQRAAFACALMAGPRIIVADEPTAELDSASSDDLLRVVRGLVKRDVAVVIATHDPSVMRQADDALELDHGRVKGEAVWGRGPDRALAGETPSPATHEPLLEVESVTKTYRRGPEKIHAVDDASLTLRSGELVGVMGRSGSGKTTLLNMIAGWERPDRGAVRFVAEGVARAPSDLRWSELAVLPQKFGLVEELTVRENVAYPARLARAVDTVQARVDELLAELGLDELADRYPAETSVGQQQRTALARALALSPRLLVADEPTGHQDAGWAGAVFESLRLAAAQGTCCLVATHNEEAAQYLDVVYTMANGRLEQA